MPDSRRRKAQKPRNSKGASEEVFGHPLRVAIYARVSVPGQQTIAMQKRQLRQYAKHRDWTIVREVEEVGSGAKRRPKRDELLEDGSGGNWTTHSARIYVPAGQRLCGEAASGSGGSLSWAGFRPY